MAAGALLATPYAFAYDMAAIVIPAAFLAADQLSRGVLEGEKAIWMGLFGIPLAVLVALGIWWLIVQVPVFRGMRSLYIEPDRGSGAATVPARLLTAAVTADLDQTPGLQRGRARLVRHRGRPELELRAKISPHADIQAARRHIEDVVIPHAREALAPQPLPTRVTVELGRRR